MTTEEKLCLLEFILENVEEYKIKDHGWVYADGDDAATMANRLAGHAYRIANPEPEDEDEE